MPLPHGNGFVGYYNISGVFPGAGLKEYIGVCLTNPMIAGKSYTLRFHMAQGAGRYTVPISLFGSANCGNIPFGGTNWNFGCPTNGPGWMELITDTVIVSNSVWAQVSLTFTPSQTINAIVLGPDCDSTTIVNDYHYLDNFHLTESNSLSSASISDSGHYCQDNLILKVKFDSVPNHIQWYRNGIALVNDTNIFYHVPPSVIGAYQVRLLYDSGCVLSDTFFVDSAIIITDISSRGGCLDLQVSGSISVRNTTGGKLPYSYSLDNGIPVLDSNLINVPSGTHLITILDSNLCSKTFTIIVDTFPEPVANYSSDTVCLNDTTHFLDLSSVSLGAIVRREWSLPGFPTAPTVSHKFPLDGVFPVNLLVESDSGCIHDTTINIVIRELPIAQFTFSPTEVYLFDAKVCFSNLSLGNIINSWNFGFNGIGSTSNLHSPCTVTFPTTNSGVYQVKLIVTNQFSCLDSSFNSVIVKDESFLYIPNSFSPNGDDINDELLIKAEGIEYIDFKIFNRWGELVFSTTDIMKGWDGTYLNEPVELGVYVYTIIYKNLNGKVLEKFGHVSVVK